MSRSFCCVPLASSTPLRLCARQPLINSLLLLSLGLPLSAQPTDLGRRLFSVPIGSGPGRLTYSFRSPEAEWVGPESFAVSDDGRIFALDTVAGELEIFSAKGERISTFALPRNNEFWDIDVAGSTAFVLSRSGNVFRVGVGESTLVFRVAPTVDSESLTGFVRTGDGSLAIRVDGGRRIEVDRHNGAAEPETIQRDGRRLHLNTLGEAITIDSDFEPAGAYALRRDRKGEVMVIEYQLAPGPALAIEAHVETFLKGARTNTFLAIPRATPAPKSPRRFLYATGDGHVYQMLLREESVDFYQLFPSQERRTLLRRMEMNAPLSPVPSTAQVKCAYARAEAYQRALYIADHQWQFKKAYLTPSKPPTMPPDFLTDAPDDSGQVGIPYCWGGMDGLDTASSSGWSNFDGAISKGQFAGNSDTWSSPAWTASTVGLDCSGFICSTYKCPRKLSTTDFTGPQSPFMALNDFRQLIQGDIANHAGDHVWMFDASVEEQGVVTGYRTVEATKSGDDKVHRHKRTVVEAQDYVAMTLR